MSTARTLQITPAAPGRLRRCALLSALSLMACATPARTLRPAAGPGEVPVAPPQIAPPQTGPAGEPQPPPAAAVPRYLEAPPDSLRALFAALAIAERGDPDGRVLVSVFGDSHTAGDRLTARLRLVLGRRFGDAGRGLVAMGKPATRHYYQTEVRYGSAGKWQLAVGGHRADPEPYGLSGLRMITRDRRAQSWVGSCADCGERGWVDRFELLYWSQPGGAKLRYRVDQRPWQTVATAAGDAHPARLVIAVPPGPHQLAVAPAGRGALELFGVALERARPGVIVDGLGVVGRTLAQLASWDWRVIGAQLAERAPRLVILQYGSNEVTDPSLPLDALARHYDQVIARVRAAAPQASILLLGPPDLATREDGKACDAPARRPQPLAELPAAAPGCRWKTPTRLLDIVELQRRAAERNGVAFFDSLAALGGADRIDEMVNAEPPLAYKDRVHLTALGYQRWADLLLAELLAAYAEAQPQPGSSMGSTSNPAATPAAAPTAAPTAAPSATSSPAARPRA